MASPVPAISPACCNPAFAARTGRTRRLWNGLSLRWINLVCLGCLWATRRRERLALLELDDNMLRDIGVCRTEANRGAALPF